MIRFSLFIVLMACPVAVAAPSLFFGPKDLPALRQRLASEAHARQWEYLLSQAKGMAAPGTRTYADPGRIDEMPAGPAPRIQVLAHRFGRKLTLWVETLGFAYQMTGEERLGQHGARILAAAADRLPVTDPRVAKSFAGARGDLVRGFAVGLDWLGDAMTDQERERVHQAAAGYVRNILAESRRPGMWWVPHHNFMGVALGAAGMVSLKLANAFPDESGPWVAECRTGVGRWLEEGFDEQGAYYEGTTYASYGLSNAIRFADALARTGDRALIEHPRLRLVPSFFALSELPGERIFDARNDANYTGLNDPWMLRMAGALDHGLAKWLWDECGAGASPMRIVWDTDVRPQPPAEAGVPLAQHFVGRGLCVFRTGWTKDDVMFSVEAGPYYRTTHNQGDKGHFTLYGLGQRWAIDSGYGNNQDPQGRAQTLAHNCILVDGAGQALSGAGLGTNGRILAFEHGAAHGYVLADCTEAYNRNNRDRPGAVVRQALRHAFFLRPSGDAGACAVVLDHIQKDDESHEYAWLLHAGGNTEVTALPDGAVVRPGAASGHAFVETPEGAGGRGSCTWPVTVAAAGKYVVWARVRSAGEAVAKSDSFFVRMDGGSAIAWHMPGRRDWVWGRVASGVAHEPVAFDLAAGRHVLRFETREPGAQFDQVVVTPDAGPSAALGAHPQARTLEAEDGQVAAPMRVVKVTPEERPSFLRVVLHAAGPLSLDTDKYDGHPRLVAKVRAINPRFVAVLMPLPYGHPEPKVVVTQQRGATRVQVQRVGRTDVVLWPTDADGRPTLTAMD